MQSGSCKGTPPLRHRQPALQLHSSLYSRTFPLLHAELAVLRARLDMGVARPHFMSRHPKEIRPRPSEFRFMSRSLFVCLFASMRLRQRFINITHLCHENEHERFNHKMSCLEFRVFKSDTNEGRTKCPHSRIRSTQLLVTRRGGGQVRWPSRKQGVGWR